MVFSATIAIIGSQGCGKSKYINLLANTSGHPTPNGAEVNIRDTYFNIREQSGITNEDFDGYIVMFDTRSSASFDQSVQTAKTLLQQGKQVVWCGTCVDSQNRVVQWNSIKEARNTLNNVKYYDISAKSGYNRDKPFIEFIETLSNPDIKHELKIELDNDIMDLDNACNMH